jgi:hypothetical protein
MRTHPEQLLIADKQTQLRCNCAIETMLAYLATIKRTSLIAPKPYLKMVVGNVKQLRGTRT